MFFLIPYYKQPHYLEATLKSLLAQSDSHWRAMVLINSPTKEDAEAGVACVKSLNDSRFTVHQNATSLPMAANWNAGLSLVQSETLVCLLHSDDQLLPDYVREMKRIANKYPEATGYFCKPEVIDEKGVPTFSFADWYKTLLVPKGEEVVLSGIAGVKALVPGNFVFCPSLCYRLPKLGNERYNESLKMVLDFDLILRVLLKGGKWVGYYGKTLFQYRRHSQNATVELSKNLIRFNEEIDLHRGLSQRLLSMNEVALSKRVAGFGIIKRQLGFQMCLSLIKFRFSDFLREFKLFLSLFGI